MLKLTLAAFYLVSLIAAFLIGEQAASTYITTTTIAEEPTQNASETVAKQELELSSSKIAENSAVDPSDEAIEGDVLNEQAARKKDQASKEQLEPEGNLQEKVTRLERKYQALNKEYQQKVTQLNDAHLILEEAGIALPDKMTLEEAQKYLPAPFDQQVANSPSFLTDQVKKLHAAEDDFEWGPEMQTRISDFILTHEYGSESQLQSVICREGICEIRAFPLDHKQWNDHIMPDLTVQAWWRFTSMSSMSGNRDPEEERENRPWLYLITSGEKIE